jgi:TrmH family RNA methyltransferase
METLSYRSKTIQRVRKVLSSRRERESKDVFVIEGEIALRDAINFGAKIDSFIVTPEKKSFVEAFAIDAPIHVVNEDAMSRLSDTRTPSGVLAFVAVNNVSLNELTRFDSLVICDAISDPGNAGTIIRSAAAAGFEGVIFSKACVDAYNPKVVRSSASALLSIPIVVNIEATEILAWCRKNEIQTVGLDPSAKHSIWDFEIPERVALVVGSESHGLTMNELDTSISIPISNGVESLNAAMATTLACFEISRRRAEMK